MTVPVGETAAKTKMAPLLTAARTLGLCLLYTAALIAVAAALDAQQDPDGVARLNFAYKVY